MPLYVFEPNVWQAARYECPTQVVATESLYELCEELAALGQPLVVRVGEVCSVLEDIRARVGVFVLWSHEESGSGVT